MSEDLPKKKKRPPAALFALGRKDMPAEVTAEGATYRFNKLFKHDFFAATGLYERTEGKGLRTETDGNTQSSVLSPLHSDFAVLKIQRTYPLYGLPMKWLGRIVAGHEIGVYEKLQGVTGIPAFLGRVGPTGFLHAFVPGVDLHSDLPLTPAFFEELWALFAALHERHIAYVDSNKRENILYGEDGKPWLIDFQISWWCRKGARDNFLAKMIFRKFVRADVYHFYKHKTRLLPSACSEEEFAKAKRRGILHKLHSLIARPLIRVRRLFLSRYDLSKTR